ncbi:MAG: multiheme c-type cytochrome, partial [Planctomycetota bacterium]
AHEIARLHVLRITWDTHGKRWFYLNPPGSNERLAPDDLLNWTSVAQRWNTMCADCHSTNLQKNFDVASGIYHTTFSEIDVSCESCHGPGSLHVQLASARSLFWDRKLGYGLAPLKAEPNDHEIHACAPCHARRRQLAAGTRPGDNFYDAYSHSLLEPTTYHADGQIQDEVYEFGSFTQSKMYHKNIRCSNCHDPHSAKLKHPGNQLCTSCHAHSAGKYDGPSHHHHEPNSSGAQCVNCHMPETHYMDVDPRRDHSLRVPRPGMSVELGTPNACTQCHLQVDKSVAKLPESKRAGLKRSEDWLPAAERDGDVRAELQRMDSGVPTRLAAGGEPKRTIRSIMLTLCKPLGNTRPTRGHSSRNWRGISPSHRGPAPRRLNTSPPFPLAKHSTPPPMHSMMTIPPYDWPRCSDLKTNCCPCAECWNLASLPIV